MKRSSRFVIGAGGADSLQPVFSNIRIFNDAIHEHDGAAYLIRKASLQVGDVAAVSEGEIALMPTAVRPSDFGRPAFSPGTVVFLCLNIDLSSRDRRIAAQGNPIYAEGESQFLYDAGMEVDDIDTTSWTAPVGADLWIPFPHPVMMLGLPSQPDNLARRHRRQYRLWRGGWIERQRLAWACSLRGKPALPVHQPHGRQGPIRCCISRQDEKLHPTGRGTGRHYRAAE